MKRKLYLSLLASMFAICAFAQNRQVTGRVIADSSKQSLAGVSVTVRGTQTVTTTNAEGRYSISVPDRNDVILVFTSIGFRAQQVPVGSGSVVDVAMTEEVSALNDIVVIGYGTARRKDVTGTVSSISGTQLEKIPVSSAAEAITGRLPGVQVTTTDGAPGAEIVIRVRGGGSITQDNSPLYIVDGFPVSSINDIAPADIASIDVLKDAATSAIYGARGANGVVIITTKSPKAGKTTINYNAYGQARTLPRRLDVLSPYEFALMQYEYARIRSQAELDNFTKYFGVYEDLELYRYQEGTDWQDKLFGNPALSQQHNLSILGGTDKTKMSFSLTNNTDEGLVPGSGYQRNFLNFKLNHEVSKVLKFDFASRFTHSVVDGAGTSGTASLRISDGITTRPVNGIADQIVIDPQGPDDDYEQFLKSLVDPLRLAEQDYRKRVNKGLNMNVAGAWNVIRGLTLRSEFGLDLGFGQVKRFYGPLTGESRNVGGNLPLGEITNSENRGFRWTNTANYLLRKGEKHDFSFLLGQELVTTNKGFSEFNRAKFFAENMQPEKLFANMTLGTPDRHTTFISAGDKLASFFGRVNYNFSDRYLFSVTARADGSSKFAPGNQWGFFPAASFAWRISRENFMESVDFVSD
ncbi:MAG TPA: SusC/RagA family TonB-linked outer membrane protein, partial [Flavisolibacter sp.]